MHDVAGYRLEHRIGRGATSEVWLARRLDAPQRPVALKRVVASDAGAAAALRAELAAEADLLAAVAHPNLLPVLDVVADGTGVAIAVPFLAGGTVRDLLDERGALPVGELVGLLAPVADAVEVLHRHGVVHGDLKPENVLLAADGAPVVADVGLARRIGARRAGGTGPPAGTPAYLDPVVVVDETAAAAPTADVYALGVIAYEALTARLPHVGEAAEVTALAAAGAHRPLASWPGVAPEVAAVVERALDPDPASRPAGPARFLADLRAVVDPAELRRPALPSPPARHRSSDGTRHVTVDLSPDLAPSVPSPARPGALVGPVAVLATVALVLVALGVAGVLTVTLAAIAGIR